MGKFVITGRTEDGRVWYNAGSWNSDRREADVYDYVSEASYAAHSLRRDQEQLNATDERWVFGIEWKEV